MARGTAELAVAASELEVSVAHPPPAQEWRGEAEHWQVAVRNRGATTALMVWLEDARDLQAKGYVTVDDNYFCLLPGECRQVMVTWAGAQRAGEERRLEIAGWNTQVLELCSQT